MEKRECRFVSEFGLVLFAVAVLSVAMIAFSGCAGRQVLWDDRVIATAGRGNVPEAGIVLGYEAGGRVVWKAVPVPLTAPQGFGNAAQAAPPAHPAANSTGKVQAPPPAK